MITIPFQLDHVFCRSSTQDEDARVLEIVFGSLVKQNRVHVRRNPVSSLAGSRISPGRVRIFDSIPSILDKGYTDRDSMAAAIVAMSMENGKNPPRAVFHLDGETGYRIDLQDPASGRMIIGGTGFAPWPGTIQFAMDHAFSPVSSRDVDAEILQILVETLVSIDEVWMAGHRTPMLYDAGVVYGRTRTWDPVPVVQRKRIADCKSLTAWRVAELRRRRRRCRPFFRFRRRPDGFSDYHILLLQSSGWEDPSKRLGMGRNENRRMTG